MVTKHYAWENAVLDEHSARKHKILREYFHQYLKTRCQLPQQEKFRLAVIDAFAGGGKYSCGSFGSPLIFIDELKKTLIEINLVRNIDGRRPIELECLFIFNDSDPNAIAILKKNIFPLQEDIKDTCPKLHIQISYFSKNFESIYLDIKSILSKGSYGNVMFILDQYNYSDVSFTTLNDIFITWKSAEAFLTYSIEALKTYISTEKEKNKVLTNDNKLLEELYDLKKDALINKSAWLGLIEKFLFNKISGYATYASPFSINNPNGWRYWLIHLANKYRARQVYNDVLHQNSSCQAHFGRSGLRMLHYDPSENGNLYLFDQNSRELAKNDLFDDIPRHILDHGDAINVMDFYANIYNETPAHSDDIHEMMLLNPDLEILTTSGNPRRSANTIKPEDTLRLKQQRSFFPIFLNRKD